MQLFNLFALLAAALVAQAAEAPTTLQIETIYKPDDCTVTAATGDSIKVHYVSCPGYGMLCTALTLSALDWKAIHHRSEIRLQVIVHASRPFGKAN